jgi:hypothetical protein
VLVLAPPSLRRVAQFGAAVCTRIPDESRKLALLIACIVKLVGPVKLHVAAYVPNLGRPVSYLEQ